MKPNSPPENVFEQNVLKKEEEENKRDLLKEQI
jgi:hypothetical protein